MEEEIKYEPVDIQYKPGVDIVIPGSVITASADNIVAYSSQIYDNVSGKCQEEINNEKVYRVEIYSTDGITMSNNSQTCTLYAQVFEGNENITDKLNDSAFVWTRNSSNENADDYWNQMNESNRIGKKQITVAYQDVDVRAMFECKVNI